MTNLKKLLFLMMSVGVLFFAGCKQNLGFDPIDKTDKTDAIGGMGKTVTLTGSLAVEGDAAPSVLLAMLGDESGRSAVTSGDMLDGYNFTFEAREAEYVNGELNISDEKKVSAVFSDTDKTKFTLTLDADKLYILWQPSITNDTNTTPLSARYEFNGKGGSKIDLSTLTGTESNTLNVFIIPNTYTTDDIPGKIALEISSAVSNVNWVGYESSFTIEQNGNTNTFSINGTLELTADPNDVTKKTGILELSQVTPERGGDSIDLPNGIYDFTFKFYNTNPKASATNVPEPVAVSYQKINVFAGFVTDTWISDGSAYFTEDAGKTDVFTVTDAAINAYNNPKEFYVKGTYVDPSAASGSGVEVTSWGIGFDSNSGTSIKKPYATLQQAIDTVIAANEEYTGNEADRPNYTIYVKDTVYPKVELDNSGALVLCKMADFTELGTTALKLTIVGVGRDAVLQGYDVDKHNCGSVINAVTGLAQNQESALNLTLKNLTITGGNSSGVDIDKGRGKKSATVTIEKCTINYNTGNGGIHNNGGTVTVTNSTIKGNTAGSGGGIYNNGGTVTIIGSTISENIANAPKGGGGGIYNAGNSTITIDSETVINSNTAYYNETSLKESEEDALVNAAFGGGIYNLGAYTINGASLTDNKAYTTYTTSSNGSNNNVPTGCAIYSKNSLEINNITITGSGDHILGVLEQDAIYLDGGTVTVSGTITLGNTIKVSENATITATGGSCTIKRDEANKNFKMIIVNEGATLNLTGSAENRIILDGNISSNENSYDSSIIDVKGSLNASYCDLKNNYKNSSQYSCAGVIETPNEKETVISLTNCIITNCGCLNTGGDKGFAGGIFVPEKTTLKLKDTQIDCSSARGYGDAVWMNSMTSKLELDGVVTGSSGKPLDVYVESSIGTANNYVPIILESTYSNASKIFVKLEGINNVSNDVLVSGCDENKAKTFEVVYVPSTGGDAEYYTITAEGKLNSAIFTQNLFMQYCSDLYESGYYDDKMALDVPNNTSVEKESGSDIYNAYKYVTSFTIPDGYKAIVGDDGASAFAGATGLVSVTIPDSVVKIGNFAFARCTNLASITIPASVTSIGQSAFDSCPSLESVTIMATTPPDLGYVSLHTGGNNTLFIFVPSSAVQTYKNACTGGNKWDDKGVLSSQIYAIGDIPIPATGISLKANTVRIGLNKEFNISDIVTIEPSNTTDTIMASLNPPLTGGAITGVTCADGKLTATDEQKDITVSISVGRFWQTFNLVVYDSDVFDSAALSWLNNDTSITSYEIPYGFTSIEGYNDGTFDHPLFTEHEDLKQITVPETVKEINAYAFGKDGDGTEPAKSLEQIVIKSETPPDITEHTFSYFTQNGGELKIVVPKGYKTAYEEKWTAIDAGLKIEEEQ